MQTLRSVETVAREELPDPTLLIYLDTIGLLDQSLFNDAVCSAIARQPLYMHLAGPLRGQPGWQGWQQQHSKLCPLTTTSADLPPSWAQLSSQPDLRYVLLGGTCS